MMSQRNRLGILVVDDDEDICLYLRDFLTREGYRVRTCSYASEALPEIKDGHYQIVLLDIRTPDPDGVSLLKQIREVDSEVVVIAMTAHPAVKGADETLQLQAFDCLRKPFELDRLRQVIQRAVREKGLLVDADERLNQNIGSRIRALRKQRTLTLKQLANKTGLSVSLISQIELGKSAASVSTLHKLSAALAVTMSYLFEDV